MEKLLPVLALIGMVLLGILIIIATRLYLYARDAEDRKFFSKNGLLEFKRRNPKILALGSIVLYLLIIILNMYIWKNDPWSVFKNSLVFLWLVPIGLIDYKEQIIPNKLVLVGLIFWILFICCDAFILKNNSIIDLLKISFFGMILGAGVFLIPAIITRNGVGMGDVKLFGVLGLLYGFAINDSTNVFTIIFFTIIIVFFAGIILMITGKANRKSTLPLAPYLLLAFTFASLMGILK